MQAEVNYLGQLHHPNLVKLLGYSLENEHRLLVYEFMPRGNLENHLFRRNFYFHYTFRIRVDKIKYYEILMHLQEEHHSIHFHGTYGLK